MAGRLAIVMWLVVVSVGIFVIGGHQETPAEKEIKIRQEVRKETWRKAMEQHLLTATKGDFVEMKSGMVFVVRNILPYEKNHTYKGEIVLCILGWQCRNTEYNFIDGVAEHAKRVIRKNDPDYPATAVKFVNQLD